MNLTNRSVVNLHNIEDTNTFNIKDIIRVKEREEVLHFFKQITKQHCYSLEMKQNKQTTHVQVSFRVSSGCDWVWVSV